jgi:hypothetical protein
MLITRSTLQEITLLQIIIINILLLLLRFKW